LGLAGLVMGRFADQVKDWLSEGLRREQHLKQRLRELAVLQEVNRKVYDLQSGDTLQNIVEVCTKVLGFRRAALFLSQKQEGLPERYFSTRPGARGEDGQELPALHFDRRLFEAMLQAERPFVVDGSQGLDAMAVGPLLEIAVALRTSSGPIGVLVVDCSDRTSVSETDVEVLSALANSATMAIENAQIHSTVQWRADHDGLTGLYNHGYFQEALRQGIVAGREKGEPLALLMVEVDNFKAYNDAYGHRQGDAVLVGLARALEACVEKRRGTVARYGGDEFVVILPELDRRGALAVADKLLVWVRTLVTANLAQRGLPGVTISQGVAVYPADAQEAGALIEAADRAMYAAKRQGGDRIKSFDEIEASSPYLPSRPLGVVEEQEEG
jgi:diguanylate cyclase (GGDEF)-like protein